MLAVVEKEAPQRLVIDSLAEIRLLARDELWYRRQLMKLREYFVGHHCTVLLVDIAPKVNPDESALNSIVNGVIQLESATPDYGPTQRRLRILKMRGQTFPTGYHDYRIRRGGLTVFPRLIAAEYRDRSARETIGSGSTRLDAALGGGLTRGASALLLGPSGTGKSVIATQIAVSAAQRGERCAMYVFDERVQTLFDRADGVGLPLEPHIERNLLSVHQVDPAELTAGEFSHVVRSAVERDGTRMIVIDSLNGYAYAMHGERTLSLHLHELSSYLSQRGVTPIFTMTQHGLLGEHIHGPFEVSYIADTVILFRHFEFEGRIHKAVSVYKHRTGAHETTIRQLRIDAGGVDFGVPFTGLSGVLTGRPIVTGPPHDGEITSTESDS